MIGYYAHHQGRGHQQRAAVLAERVAARTGEPVTVLSSAEPPVGHRGPWVVLPRDDEPAVRPGEADPTARGHLHWVPRGHAGLRARSAALSSWLADPEVRLVVSDVSQEVALLARLHGVPVVSVVLPGRRGDEAHRLGLGVSDALVGFWPRSAAGHGGGMVRGLAPGDVARVQALGALSRFAPGRSSSASSKLSARSKPSARSAPRTVTVLDSRGGVGFDPAALARAAADTPGWRWQVLGGATWTDDPWPLVRSSDIVVCHAGQNSLAEVAAAGVPAVVVPEDRPHEEQRTTASVLAAGPWPVLVEERFPADGWADRLDQTAALDGSAWDDWCDGRAADRFARVVAGVLAGDGLDLVGDGLDLVGVPA